jgi:hypothetical protein
MGRKVRWVDRGNWESALRFRSGSLVFDLSVHDYDQEEENTFGCDPLNPTRGMVSWSVRAVKSRKAVNALGYGAFYGVAEGHAVNREAARSAAVLGAEQFFEMVLRCKS